MQTHYATSRSAAAILFGSFWLRFGLLSVVMLPLRFPSVFCSLLKVIVDPIPENEYKLGLAVLQIQVRDMGAQRTLGDRAAHYPIISTWMANRREPVIQAQDCLAHLVTGNRCYKKGRE